jgi:hypothetical protein
VSVATIRAQVVTTLDAIAGVSNVYSEEVSTFEHQERMDGDRVHFWHVYIDTMPTDHGIGFVEMQRRVRIEGFVGVARDDPTDGSASDTQAKNLLDLITSTFASSTNRTLSGVVLDSVDYTPDQVTLVAKQIGDEAHPCHRLAFSFMTSEDA